MTPDDPMTNGEIGRILMRQDAATSAYRASHHEQMDQLNALIGRLSDKIDRYIGPVAVLQKQADSAERAAESLTGRVTHLESQTAKVLGAATMVGFLAGLIPKWLK